MKLLIICIIVFLIIVYGYTFIRIKKRRRSNASMNHIKEFHDKYHPELSNNYLTNSKPSVMDFVDKNEFVADIQKEVHDNTFIKEFH